MLPLILASHLIRFRRDRQSGDAFDTAWEREALETPTAALLPAVIALALPLAVAGAVGMISP